MLNKTQWLKRETHDQSSRGHQPHQGTHIVETFDQRKDPMTKRTVNMLQLWDANNDIHYVHPDAVESVTTDEYGDTTLHLRSGRKIRLNSGTHDAEDVMMMIDEEAAKAFRSDVLRNVIEKK